MVTSSVKCIKRAACVRIKGSAGMVRQNEGAGKIETREKRWTASVFVEMKRKVKKYQCKVKHKDKKLDVVCT